MGEPRPSLSIAKGSAIAMDRRRDIIVVERTMLRTDCDTYASLLAPPSGRGRSRRLSIRPVNGNKPDWKHWPCAGLGDRLVRLGFGKTSRAASTNNSSQRLKCAGSIGKWI